MTHDEILALPAGPELDAVMARKVMGFELAPADDEGFRWWDGPNRKCYLYEENTFHPSTEIEAAWTVIKKMQMETTSFGVYWNPEGWYACFDDGNRHYGYAEKAPLAICRAALLTILE